MTPPHGYSSRKMEQQQAGRARARRCIWAAEIPSRTRRAHTKLRTVQLAFPDRRSGSRRWIATMKSSQMTDFQISHARKTSLHYCNINLSRQGIPTEGPRNGDPAGRLIIGAGDRKNMTGRYNNGREFRLKTFRASHANPHLSLAFRPGMRTLCGWRKHLHSHSRKTSTDLASTKLVDIWS